MYGATRHKAVRGRLSVSHSVTKSVDCSMFFFGRFFIRKLGHELNEILPRRPEILGIDLFFAIIVGVLAVTESRGP